MTLSNKINKEATKHFEKRIRKNYRKTKGWNFTRRGWPDYFIFNELTQEAVFVELKGGEHEFHDHQKEVMLRLKQAKKISILLARYNRKSKRVSYQSVTQMTK